MYESLALMFAKAKHELDGLGGKINYSQTSGGANRFIPNFLSLVPDQKSHLTPWADPRAIQNNRKF